MKPQLFLWAITASLAGFLFGFDTVVISGAEQTIQSLWSLDDVTHGLAMSMALWGTVAGALLGSWPTDRFGRKQTLLWIGILYLVSALWSALATGPISFMIARFIGGVGVGVSTIAAPLFISEVAPPDKRGRLSGMFQFNIVLGILVAYLSNALIGQLGENAWRWMLGVEAIPALLYTCGSLCLPESPRWLITYRDDRQTALATLRRTTNFSSEEEANQLVESIAAAGHAHATDHRPFWSKRLQVPILLAFLVAFFNQLSGINAILYFAPRIFSLAGLTQQAALLQSIGIGLVNLIFTFLGLYLIDRLGRKTLLYIGSIGYIISLGVCSATFFVYEPEFRISSAANQLLERSEKYETEGVNLANPEAELQESIDGLATALEGENEPSASELTAADSLTELQGVAERAKQLAGERIGAGDMTVLICIFAFIAAHAVGQGAVIWVLISEIFPNRHRAAGQSLGSFTHWIFAALLTLAFPPMVNTFAPGFVFGFFCLMMVLQLVWVATCVPETKGVSLEELQHKLIGKGDDEHF